MTLQKAFTPIALLGILLAGALCYLRAIHSEFIYDDTLRIASAVIRDGRVLFEPRPALTQGLGYVLGSELADRPLLMLTIWANYAWGGVSPIGYKITNILLHLAVAALYYFFLLRLSRFFSRPASRGFAALMALLFVVHPLHSQAVTMVIQRGVLLSALFSLLSLLSAFAFLDGKSWNHSLLSGFLFLCALLCKPNAFTLPLMVLLFACAAEKKRGLRDLLVPQLLACVFPAVFYLVYRDNFHAQSGHAGSWVQYGLVQSRVVFHYLRQVIWPNDINATYPFASAATFSEVWPYCLAHAGILALAALGSRRSSLPAVALLAFYLALVPESSFFPIPHVAFDHRMYLPALFLGAALYAWLAGLRAETPKRPIAALLLLAGFPLAFATWQRNEETLSYVRWLETTARRNPADHLAGLNALSVLWSVEPAPNGLALARDLRDFHAGAPEYELLYQLFSLPSEAEKKAAVSGVLLSRDYDFLSPITRLNLLQWRISLLQKDRDPGRAQEEVVVLLAQQERFLRQEIFQPMESFFRLRKSALFSHYLALTEKGQLAPYQREILFSLLPDFPGQLGRLPLLERYLFELRRNRALSSHALHASPQHQPPGDADLALRPAMG